MLKERVAFTVRTNFIYLTCRTQTFNNNKDNFITIYSICVCVCTHCVLKLLFEVRGKALGTCQMYPNVRFSFFVVSFHTHKKSKIVKENDENEVDGDVKHANGRRRTAAQKNMPAKVGFRSLNNNGLTLNFWGLGFRVYQGLQIVPQAVY